MKILYITPTIKDEGGVSRVLSVKTNYLVEKFEYDIHIIAQDSGDVPFFYDFNKKIKHHTIILKRNRLQYLFRYCKALHHCINKINPDIIVVCDNGIKGCLFRLLIKTTIPVVFEIHCSKFIDERKSKPTLFTKSKYYVSLVLKSFAVKMFKTVILLSEESRKEWGLEKGQIIPNPNWFTSTKKSLLNSKKAISVSRHCYEKGIDLLLLVWQKVVLQYPDWVLDIYGNMDDNKTYLKLAKELQIEHCVNFFEPVKEIQGKYNEASIYVMTSRFEAFPMVLIEAMSSGLPCVAFDCPIGPRALIKNDYNGFLIPEKQINLYANCVIELIENNEVLKRIGSNAFETSKKYDLDLIMKKWNSLFESLAKN
ncbi:glycosyltransferase [Flavobacterium sp.]|uniref:glycosyltransferase n=1 Tax=Flavobacterium sp. TaxID=239 RepID=UPI00286E081B|nr:glycosyltransferase [Flavobacterium sp.]